MNLQNFHFTSSLKTAGFSYTTGNLLPIISVRSKAKCPFLYVGAVCTVFCHIIMYMCSRFLVLRMQTVHELFCIQHMKREALLLRISMLLTICSVSLFSVPSLSCSSCNRHLGKIGHVACAKLYWGTGNMTYDQPIHLLLCLSEGKHEAYSDTLLQPLPSEVKFTP